MPGVEVGENGISDTAATQNKPDARGGRSGSQIADIGDVTQTPRDDDELKTQLAFSRALSLSAGAESGHQPDTEARNRLKLVEQKLQVYANRDLERSDLITRMLGEFAKSLLESSQKVVSFAEAANSDGFLSEVSTMLYLVQGTWSLLDVANKARDLTLLQLGVVEALTPLYKTLQFASKQLIMDYEEEVLEPTNTIEHEAEAVLEAIRQLDFSDQADFTPRSLDFQSILARAPAGERATNQVQLETEQTARLVEAFQKRIAELETRAGESDLLKIYFDNEIRKLISFIAQFVESTDQYIQKEFEFFLKSSVKIPAGESLTAEILFKIRTIIDSWSQLRTLCNHFQEAGINIQSTHPELEALGNFYADLVEWAGGNLDTIYTHRGQVTIYVNYNKFLTVIKPKVEELKIFDLDSVKEETNL